MSLSLFKSFQEFPNVPGIMFKFYIQLAVPICEGHETSSTGRQNLQRPQLLGFEVITICFTETMSPMACPQPTTELMKMLWQTVLWTQGSVRGCLNPGLLQGLAEPFQGCMASRMLPPKLFSLRVTLTETLRNFS